jgi:hypothetical protein
VISGTDGETPQPTARQKALPAKKTGSSGSFSPGSILSVAGKAITLNFAGKRSSHSPRTLHNREHSVFWQIAVAAISVFRREKQIFFDWHNL